MQRSGISHILSGRNKPSLDFVLKVIEAYPDLNESWLLKGEGEMLKTGEPKELFAINEVDKQAEALVETIASEPLVVKSEDAAYYKTDSKLAGIKEEIFVENTAVKPVEIDERLIVDKVISEKKNNKSLVKLIAIYDDDSFKVYHSE